MQRTSFAQNGQKSGFYVLAVLVIAAVVATGIPGTAQTSNSDYLYDTGFPTFTTALPVQKGNLNVSNGNLHLEIPLGTYPQRGGVLKMQPRLVYNSRIWIPVNNGTSTVWSPGTSGNNTGWQYVDYIASATVAYNSVYTPCTGGGYTTNSSFTWTDGEGTKRYFAIQTIQNTSGVCGPASVSSGDAWAADSSGYHMYVTNYTTVKVYSRDGTEVDQLYQDTNGNKFTLDGNGNTVDTVGRVPTSQQTGTYNINVLTSQGTTVTYGITATQISVTTAFGQTGVTEYSGTLQQIGTLSLPDGTNYQFTYDAYGELATMKVPAGGQVSFGYANFTDATGNVNRWTTSYTAGGGTWSYSPQVISTCPTGGTGCQQKVTVTKPSNDSIIYTFTLTGGAWTSQAQYYDHSGSLLATVTHDFDYSNTCSGCAVPAYVRVTRDTTTVPGAGGSNISKKTEYSYDSPQTGNMTAVKDWRFYSGTPSATPDKETDTAYASIGVRGTTIYKPSSVTVLQSGTQIAKTLYTYDSTALTSVTGIFNHDDTNYGTNNAVRGNLTQVQQWVSGTNYLTTTTSYDTTGQIVQTSDSAGNATSYGYSDRYYNDNGANPPTSYSPSAPTNAYQTSVTVPIIGTKTIGYYYGTGKIAVTTDQNGTTAYSHFVDPLDRPTLSMDAAGGWIQTVYSSATQTDVYTGINDQTPSSTCTSCRHDQTILDNLGRVTRTSLASDPEGATLKDTSYDTNSRANTTSNPYRSTTDPTYGSSSKTFDGLDRIIQLTRPDGNATQTAFGASAGSVSQSCSATTYGIGYPVLETDEAGKKKLIWADGFGRMIEVDEANSSNIPSIATCYQYDVLNNLLQVQQQSESRTYHYDGVSRLTNATIPEAGTTTYSYATSSGALCSGDPKNVCYQSDARNITTTSTYDALNRVTLKTYSDGTTPSVSYVYDQSSVWGLSLSNTKGRLTHVSVAGNKSQRVFTYDAVGRITMQAECLPSNCGTSAYTTYLSYDKAGDLSSVTYPSGRKVNYNYTNAKRIQSVVLALMDGQSMNYAYASSAKYSPQGALSSVTLDNATSSALSETYTFNNRLQMVSGKVASSSSTFMNHTLAFVDSNGKNNGNVQSITDQMNSARNQTFGYDQLNRLSSAVETAWGLSFGYDLYGNLLQQNVTLGSAPSLNLIVNTNNQIAGTGFSYDAAGHLTADGTNTYVYDGAGGVSSLNNGAATYTYDPSELRVRKDVGSSYTEYARVLGHVIAERDSSGNWTDYIFMGNRRIARAADYDTSVAIHGTNSSSGEWTLFYLNNAAGLSGYTIRSGDKLYLTQWQKSGSRGGMVFGFTDGSDSNRSVTDQDGYFLNDDQTQGATHFRSVDLSSFAGKSVHDLAFVSESDTSVGAWEIDYEQAALVSTDGTVRPIYTGESSISIGTIKSSDGGVTGRNYTVDTNTGNGTLPQQTTVYYHSDRVGSARMMTTGYAYPVWQATYLPFGNEYNPQITTNHYKFSGYEHDSESGLENAEARMLSSQLARFTSPDPYMRSMSVPNPQSLNRYSYVLNNPLNASDPFGLYCQWDDGTADDEYGEGGVDFGGCIDQGGTWIDSTVVNVVGDAGGGPDVVTITENGQPIDPGQPTDPNSGGGSPYSGTPYRVPLVPGTNWCGPGGWGSTMTRIDGACQAHDACYDSAGASWFDNVFGTGGQAVQAGIAACNRRLCQDINLSDPTSQEAGQAFFVGAAFGCIP